METNEGMIQEDKAALRRSISAESTTIMSNTESSRHDRVLESIEPQATLNHNIENASKQKKKESSSLLDRLTIVDVEASSSRKKKGRRKRRNSLHRNDESLPVELLLREKQDSVSMIPDCFSNSNTFSKDDEVDLHLGVHDNEPTLFTFDLIPSLSEDMSQRENRKETCDEGDSAGDSAGYSAGNDTTDANIGEEDDISGIFYELEERDNKCIEDVEAKYFFRKNDYLTASENNVNESNMEAVAASTKLELTSRTRTDTTAYLTEISSNDTSLQVERETTQTSKHLRNGKKTRKNEARLTGHNDLQAKASRCVSLNIFSMFESM